MFNITKKAILGRKLQKGNLWFKIKKGNLCLTLQKKTILGRKLKKGNLWFKIIKKAIFGSKL